MTLNVILRRLNEFGSVGPGHYLR